MVKPRKNREEDNGEFSTTSTSDLVKLIAAQQATLTQQQSVLQTLAQQLVTTTTSGTTSGSVHPTSGTPPVIRGIQLPRLAGPDELTIPLFRDWKRRWEDYSNSNLLSSHSLDTQQGILRSALNPEWTMLWSSDRLQIKTTSTMPEVIQLLEAYLRRRRNPLLDRQEFHRRDQQAGESVDRYFSALKSLDDACSHDVDFQCDKCASACSMKCSGTRCKQDFPLIKHLQETRIRDRLICGLIDKEMQKKVLAEQYSAVLTLERVLSICIAVENSNSVGATLSAPKGSHPEVQVANKKKSTYKKKQANSQPSASKSEEGSCWNCGKTPRHLRTECPAREATCKSCGKIGHYAKLCRKSKKDDKKQATPPPTENKATHTVTIAGAQKLLRMDTIINNVTCSINWLPDTGSEVDAINEDLFLQLGGTVQSALLGEKLEVVAANKKSLGPVGTVAATIKYNGMSYSTKIGVYKHLSKPLLSDNGCKALGLIPDDWPFHSISNHESNAISTGKKIIVKTAPQSRATLQATREEIIKEHSEAFDDNVLRPMSGPPMKIELVAEAVPSKRYKAYNIPFHWRDKVKEGLESMMKKGVIESVPVGEAIDWCHPMVVIPKKGSMEPRITVDLTLLNKYVRRPAYPVKVPREVVARIPPGMRYFTTLDARHGYWQVDLDKGSRKLTTFITPWGCYRFCRNVMGLISAGDEHNRRGDEALQGISNVEKVVEDIIIYDKDLPSHIQRVKEVISRCRQNGITLNLKKFVFAQPEVEWCGFQITSHGYTPAPHLYSALARFPVPTNKTDIRSFCGLVQQFESFSHSITELVAPIRSLLSSKATFVWEQPHQQSFEQVIKELCSSRVLAQFQPNHPLRLETDAAQSKGLGYALLQQQSDGTWRPLQVGSRYVTPTEARYSASEVEMLAVAWAVRKCRLYLLGHPFELIVDHRPLIPIINSKTLDEIENPRLQRLKEKLSSYRAHAIWRAGVKHTVVDVFSRHPVSDPDEEDLNMGLDDDTTLLNAASLEDVNDGSQVISDPLIQGIKEAAELSSEYTRLKGCILKGFSTKEKLDDDLRQYWSARDNLSLHDNLIFHGSRLLIPKTMRPAVLTTLHSSHQGQDRTLRRARQSVFWPGITNDVRNVVKTCKDCVAFLPSQQKETLVTDPLPIYPFQQVGVDLFSYAGYEYMVMVDRFSGWINVTKCGTSANTSNVIHALRKWMADFGIPENLMSDNGPQYSSLEFRNWTKKWNIQHSTSSPHFPQSNGLAESAVKSIKYLLAKAAVNGNINSEAFLDGLMELRNTPRTDGRSPAQIVFGAPTRTKLPLHRSRFAEEWKTRATDCDNRAIKLRDKAQERYNADAKDLRPFSKGDIVWVQDHRTRHWTLIAEIMETCHRGRSYLLRTESGRILRRNRRFLRKYSPKEQIDTAPVDPTPNEPVRRSTRQRKPPIRYNNFVGWNQRVPSRGRACGIMHHISPSVTSGLNVNSKGQSPLTNAMPPTRRTSS